MIIDKTDPSNPLKRENYCKHSLETFAKGSRQEVFCEKGFLRNFAKFTGKHLCQSLFFKKETLAQMFSCQFCEISKNTFSNRTPPVAAYLRLLDLIW